MRLHPREMVVRQAKCDLLNAILDVVAKHELTEGEQLSVVAGELSSWVMGVAKYAIREERHGDPEKCGGLSYEEPRLVGGRKKP